MQARGAPSKLSRWRAKQSEAAARRAQRARGGSSGEGWHLVVYVFGLGAVCLLLLQLIVTIFRSNDPADTLSNGLESKLRAEASRENRLGGGISGGGGGGLISGDQLAPGPEPDVEGLAHRIADALAPFQTKYLESIGAPLPPCDPQDVVWADFEPGFLSGCPKIGCKVFDTLEEAKAACAADESCGGITKTGGSLELRYSRDPQDSEHGEVSSVRSVCKRKSNAIEVWDAFRRTVETALNEDDNLHLSTTYEAREDDSIFMAISTYRDTTCPDTLRGAFMSAKHPEKLFVGIVQQNCNVQNCFTGTGWGHTRKWVPQDGPDVDCAEAFCAEFPEVCRKQVRILRLGERESYGPFFGRYLNSKLYRGENFYVQIDAHTEFRADWDYWLIDQMRRTKSYPYSVISNYPPAGDPKKTGRWAAPNGYTEPSPSALCGCTFEDAGGTHHTVRLRETPRSIAENVDTSVPHHSAFVAAGFFVAHGSIVKNVPFDPFLPYLFMGEEISLTIRFWTGGYDIYGPAINVLRHEYVRKESPKFWESISMVFSNGGLHNGLTDLIIPRVQNLVGWKDEPPRSESVFTRKDEFGCGNKRSSYQFVKAMQIQIRSLRQTAPTWCLHGTDMPEDVRAWKENT
ncbi:Skp1-protein-hydroxyproline N-acetylglucosaminyltransferase [Hondaea fermentalgiana]|uniref:Skp1-protein-hydroxyproline N-acetylglucosaminyltransferase n=1 Tax=Hondaea fermentalgiana TaxID=2315210 RepID=A0A2R5GFB4_9STRA|nr:Skp1-protein-hydroxyproline N-acetylglucosaminyltransferase [Hondaea fermentalgiana]|eukprot:GBG29265.1 Skp1-protein-hydroxyproline N-acetylglucosaminyltransferase [Hondaea fermentalgiana]